MHRIIATLSNIKAYAFLVLFTIVLNLKVLSQSSNSGGGNSSSNSGSNSSSSSNLKEVQFDFSNNMLLWNGTATVTPCIEGFNLRIVNVPSFSTTTKFTINIYESTGGVRDSTRARLLNPLKRKSKLRLDNTIPPKKYITYAPDNKNINIVTITGLRFKRYYYIEVIMEGIDDKGNRSFGTSKSPKIDTTIVATSTTVSEGNVLKTGTVVTVITHTVVSTPSEKKDEKNTGTKVIENKAPEKVRFYSTAAKKELVYFEFFGAVGVVAFCNNSNKNWQSNGAIATGVKFRGWPTSSNSSYKKPYALYHGWSRFSIVLGSVINNLNYGSTSINGIAIGIKPLIALDWEPCNIIGITVGAVIGKQDQKNALSNTTTPVAGLWLGISFSFEVFQLFKNNVAGINLPSISTVPTNSN